MVNRSVIMKIVLSLPLFLMMAIPFKSAANDYVRGDVNEDGTVGISDVLV